MGFPKSNTFVPITDISTRFQVHLPPCKSLANSFAHLGNRIKVFLAGNKQTNLGQAAPSSAWVGSRHLNVRLATSRVKFNIQPGFEITCNFTIMHCHHQIGFRGWIERGVQKVGGEQMRCGSPWKQLNRPSLSFAGPEKDSLDPPTYPSSHLLHFQSLHSVRTRKPSPSPDTTPVNDILRILENFTLQMLVQHQTHLYLRCQRDTGVEWCPQPLQWLRLFLLRFKVRIWIVFSTYFKMAVLGRVHCVTFNAR